MAFDLYKRVTEKLASNNFIPETPDVPKEIRNYLGELGMLQHIPYHYLIPDERYLHLKEGNDGGIIKLFWLDTEWLECLMDGALSIGAEADRELLLAKAMAGNYTAEVFYERSKDQIKQQLKGLYAPAEFDDKMQQRLAMKKINLNDQGQPLPTVAQNNWCYTGMIVRSVLVSSWKGVEITAKGKDKVNQGNQRDLQVVRQERMANDTLLVMCEGIIEEVEIVQPPEGFHFGFNATTQEESGWPFKSKSGVVNVQQLAQQIGAINSAQCARELASDPLKVKIKVDWKEI